MTRAVLDANVLVSAILSPQGIPARVLTAWRGEQFHLVLSGPIVDEIDRVLHYPRTARRHRWSDERRQGVIEDLAHLAIVTPGAVHLTVIPKDPPDGRYLECAIEGEADYIVTGDQHLLELGEYQGIRILTPRAFLDVLRRQPRP